jgi:hypothetical protein
MHTHTQTKKKNKKRISGSQTTGAGYSFLFKNKISLLWGLMGENPP